LGLATEAPSEQSIPNIRRSEVHRKLLKKQGFAPTELETEKLLSYWVARQQLAMAAHYE
jgi:hypothetical protein